MALRLAAAAIGLVLAILWRCLSVGYYSSRACHARELLRALEAAGATVAARLEFAETAASGLGVYAGESLPVNATLITLPRHLWLASAGCPTDGSECLGLSSGSRLALAIGRERRSPTSPHLAAYIATLPTSCPPNLAARPEAEAAAAAPLHAWKAEVLRRDLHVLRTELPEADEAERRLIACLKLSRAFNDQRPPATVNSGGSAALALEPRTSSC
jgi:hypothetical protein